jgi:hypothetical protein
VKGTRLLWALLVIQLILVLCAQQGRVYLDDEVGTWRAAGGSFGAILTSFDEWQTQPGYFLLAKLCSLPLGVSEFALRLPALVFGLLLTAATYALVTSLVDRRAGILSAALVGLHPFVVFYSQMARGYTMAMALVVVSLFCVQRLASGKGGIPTGLACTVARAGSVYAHLGACATIVAEVLLALCVAHGSAAEAKRRNLLRALAWVGAGGLLAIALYGPLFSGMLAFRERWTGENRGGFSLGFLPLVARAYGGGSLLGTGLLVLLGLVGLGSLLAKQRERSTAMVLFLGSLAVLGFYWALDTAHYPWAFARFLAPALPLLLALAGIGLARGGQRLVARLGVGSMAGILALVFLVAYRDTASVAFDPRDVAWPDVLEEIVADGPRTLVLAPVRFHASEPYLEQLSGSGIRVISTDSLLAILARGGLSELSRVPLTVLQDVVPCESLSSSFSVSTFGTTTRLDWDNEGDSPESLLRALRDLSLKQVEFLKPREGVPIAGRWVFWRIHKNHEHTSDATLSHGAAEALLAVTSGLLGSATEAEEAFRRAQELRDAVPVPGDVVSQWQ